MSHHGAIVSWNRQEAVFTDNRYSRVHAWRFDGGASVAASSSPSVVPVPYSDPACVDPEEAFVAAIASCHMLWFLSIAAKQGFCIERYEDRASGEMGKGADGRLAITTITLSPVIEFQGGRSPDDPAVDALHAEAHANCFLAASVRSEIRIEGKWRVRP